MNLVVRTDGMKENLLDDPAIEKILAPFDPVPSEEPFFLNDKCYHYLTLKTSERLEDLIDSLMQVDGIESVYEKPLDLPPM